MVKWNTHMKISSSLQNNIYIKIGDLVWAGPVQKRHPGIVIERKNINFGWNSELLESWVILTNGNLETYTTDYVELILDKKLFNYLGYNLAYGIKND